MSKPKDKEQPDTRSCTQVPMQKLSSYNSWLRQAGMLEKKQIKGQGRPFKLLLLLL